MMIEASASSGYPMAVAYCHLMGWNGLEKDEKKAFEMFLKIEKETNGDHWAQLMLGWSTEMDMARIKMTTKELSSTPNQQSRGTILQ